jgi:NitT/TauT family transport system ATP-binding protein
MRTQGQDQAATPRVGEESASGIRVESLNVTFPPREPGGQPYRAVDDVSFTIRRGELLVMVGRSGCGKTTVLNTIAGLQEPTSGLVEVLGTDVRSARDRVGYMFARDGLLPWRNARRNVEFALEIRHRKMPRAKRREIAREYLAKLGIGQAERLYPWQLSQGMRQRVAIARTWAIHPEVLLMDEPFAALDAQTKGEVQEEFLEVWARERRTALFVTHDLKEAVLLADRILVMSGGRIIDEVVVDIERPRRDATLVEHPKFAGINHRLIKGLIDPNA